MNPAFASRCCCHFLFGVLILAAGGRLALGQSEAKRDADEIAEAAGVKTTVKGDVVRIEWPRRDVRVNVDGVSLEPFAGLGSWAAFHATHDGTMMMGDTVVFADEITPAMDAAFEHGLEVTAIHNHFVFDEPKVYFMHIGGNGPSKDLARGVKAVWDAIKEVRRGQSSPAKGYGGGVPKVGEIQAAVIEKSLGHKSQSKDGVVKVSIGREGTMHGMNVGEAMGLNTWAAFSGSDKLAVVDGDFIMTAEEVQPVLRALRKADINIVALHNHMIGEEPAFYFLHFWGKGTTRKLADGIRSALDAQAGAAKSSGKH